MVGPSTGKFLWFLTCSPVPLFLFKFVKIYMFLFWELKLEHKSTVLKLSSHLNVIWTLFKNVVLPVTVLATGTLIYKVNVTGARIYRPSFHENTVKTLVFSHRKRACWACFRENWVYKFGHRNYDEQSYNFRCITLSSSLSIQNFLLFFYSFIYPSHIRSDVSNISIRGGTIQAHRPPPPCFLERGGGLAYVN